MPPSLTHTIVFFALYAFAGWLLECVYRSLSQRQWVNPGFLHGPFVPLYGFGTAFVIALGHLLGAQPVVVLVLAYGLALTSLEYLVGLLLESVLHLRLWDYSDERFNLHGRVCLKFSALWTGLAFGFERLLHPLVATELNALHPVIVQYVAFAFVAYLGADAAAAVVSAQTFKTLMARLHAEYLKQSDAEIERMLARVKRLRQAFPHLNKQLFLGLNQNLRRVVDERIQESYQQLMAKMEQRRPFEEEYLGLVTDILEHPQFLRTKDFFHHDSSIYEHARRVSYLTYRLCKQLGLDYRSAARGGLLHDFFLYDWRNHDEPDLARDKFHGLAHPKIALANAETHFELNNIERDCIVKHMWPLTLRPPRYKEAFIVSLIDKYLASKEFITRNTQTTRNRSDG